MHRNPICIIPDALRIHNKIIIAYVLKRYGRFKFITMCSRTAQTVAKCAVGAMAHIGANSVIWWHHFSPVGIANNKLFQTVKKFLYKYGYNYDGNRNNNWNTDYLI